MSQCRCKKDGSYITLDAKTVIDLSEKTIKRIRDYQERKTRKDIEEYVDRRNNERKEYAKKGFWGRIAFGLATDIWKPDLTELTYDEVYKEVVRMHEKNDWRLGYPSFCVAGNASVGVAQSLIKMAKASKDGTVEVCRTDYECIC